MHLRRSQSPAERDYESKGGGLSSRNRSPGYRYRDQGRDNGYGDRSRRERSETDGRGGRGYGGRGGDRDVREDRSSRPRDQGWGSRAVAKPGDPEYGSKERELERQRERERYELDVKGEVRGRRLFGHVRATLTGRTLRSRSSRISAALVCWRRRRIQSKAWNSSTTSLQKRGSRSRTGGCMCSRGRSSWVSWPL